eukprot:jgi/Chlat1/1862/Chrsp141S02175
MAAQAVRCCAPVVSGIVSGLASVSTTNAVRSQSKSTDSLSSKAHYADLRVHISSRAYSIRKRPQGVVAIQAPTSGSVAEPGTLIPPPTPTQDPHHENPVLAGNFGPVSRELSANNLPVIGQIPADFPNGSFLRNGPNPMYEPLQSELPVLGKTAHHWFEGDGMLHKTSVRGGRASYQNRYVMTEALKKEIKAGKRLTRGVVDADPLALILNAALNQLRIGSVNKNTANTSVIHHAGRLFALHEGSPPTELRLEDLSTVGEQTFNGKLDFPFTAHPKMDPDTNELVFFGAGGRTTPPFVNIGVLSATGDLVHSAPIDVPVPTLMHDCFITAQYTVLLDFPLTIRPEKMFDGGFIQFEKDRKARIGVVPRYGTNKDIRWYEVNTCYMFHGLNAFEHGDTLILRGCRAEQIDLVAPKKEDLQPWLESWLSPDGENFAKQNISRMYEWRINLSSGEVEEAYFTLPGEELVVGDFPRINDSYIGKKHRYGYITESDLKKALENRGVGVNKALVKYDFGPDGLSQTPTILRHNMADGMYATEAVFVECKGAKEEDDGYLVCYAHDEKRGVSEVHIIDAKRFEEAPVARIVLPQRVPYGFHGWFVPEAAIE